MIFTHYHPDHAHNKAERRDRLAFVLVTILNDVLLLVIIAILLLKHS